MTAGSGFASVSAPAPAAETGKVPAGGGDTACTNEKKAGRDPALLCLRLIRCQSLMATDAWRSVCGALNQSGTLSHCVPAP